MSSRVLKRSGKFQPGYVALERALSKLGIASRTVARSWIQEGRVRVNDTIRLDPQFAVFPERSKIEVDEEKVEKAEYRTFLFHKPRSVVTTRSDEKGRPTVFSFLEKESTHLCAVGRLDFATSGLLILTNDTRLADWLTDPKNGVARVYAVSVRGKMSDQELERLKSGVDDQGERLNTDEVILRKSSGKESHLVVTLSEGKNREIRRMFKALGHEVTRLKRVSYGGLSLGQLQPGEYRELKTQELEEAFPEVPKRK